jgi:hypothetical protein
MVEIIFTVLRLMGAVTMLGVVAWLVWCSNDVLSAKEEYDKLYDKKIRDE